MGLSISLPMYYTCCGLYIQKKSQMITNKLIGNQKHFICSVSEFRRKNFTLRNTKDGEWKSQLHIGSYILIWHTSPYSPLMIKAES